MAQQQGGMPMGVQETMVQPPGPPADRAVQVNMTPEEEARMQKAAELAYRLGDIPEATISQLIQLWIKWGYALLRQHAMVSQGFK